ncbi:hypothetical protein [Spiroplasma platyhelix]|uniref:Lipoprotein n=1 Tax=Spiroplasma platyhelix PALS-1 TaxID=1276218 RepID=A0A846U066_9MOLU|nr:hypothetical protein [Spiroplasma platyhelix]MBE4703863.1 hypothetical protein [Spiroplasma platyhelix PALS-1]NKE38236.1 hypothetical protein [Spiroplasma platyhelix PALS-1]UJB29121.1 hypothetical protein SPLAT_v1c03570 [Spiroplasma platyhelix PALS-1]
MKKLLKLLFVLSGTTTLPLSVIACGQESLDDTLNIIYKGETKYSINNILPDKKNEPFKDKYSLSTQDSTALAKGIFQVILDKAKNETEIIWADENPESNQKAYSFKITNGTKKENETDLSWNVQKTTGTILVNISYLVGTINSEQKFDAKQKIDMSFVIKCCISESDNIVDEWVNLFNKQISEQKWNNDQPLEINLKEKNIELPKAKVDWTDLDAKVQKETNEVLKKQIQEIETKYSASWTIRSEETLSMDLKLKIYLSVSKNNAKQNTETFYIWFK